MTLFRRFGVEWRWDLMILITVSWLLGLFCTYEIVHALHIHTTDTNIILTNVAAEMKRSSDDIAKNSNREQELIKRFDEIEKEQRVMKAADEARLEQLQQILKKLQKVK